MEQQQQRERERENKTILRERNVIREETFKGKRERLEKAAKEASGELGLPHASAISLGCFLKFRNAAPSCLSSVVINCPGLAAS